VRTVASEVERALGLILRLESVELTVAGRTDAGVHAWGQVASYDGPPASVRALNAVLPSDVAVLSCVAASDGFDARRDATSRAYCYRVLARGARSVFERGRALWFARPLDFSALSACASALVGTHDFTAFTPKETYHERFSREVFAAFWRRGAGSDVLEFWIEADAFMRQMNRVLVGTMLEVGIGRRTVASFVELLSGRPRSDAGPTAPAHGLYLAGVGYRGEPVLRDGVAPGPCDDTAPAPGCTWPAWATVANRCCGAGVAPGRCDDTASALGPCDEIAPASGPCDETAPAWATVASGCWGTGVAPGPCDGTAPASDGFVPGLSRLCDK
jgi:tRNA pseudouridine38-40 synthase